MSSKSPGFGSSDPTDNRDLLDWKSKYPAEAQSEILREAVYLSFLLFSSPILMWILWSGLPNQWCWISAERGEPLTRYGLAWIAGMLGGTLFDLKWLYHVVARQTWHMDRRLWRFFTPHISGALGFSVTVLVASGFVGIFDQSAVDSNTTVVGLAFLTGYFSDTAIAKLYEVAETILGPSRSKKPNNDHEDTLSSTNKERE